MSTSSAKVLLITGGSRGIGAATARLAGQRGWDVVVNYAGNKTAAEAVVADVRKAGSKAIAVQADVAKPEDIARLFKTADAEFGRLNAFFNNAGIVEKASKFVDIAPDRLKRILAINTTGAFLAAQEAAPAWRSRGGRGGVIVNMSSMAAKLGGSNRSTDYATARGAIDSLTSCSPGSWRPKASASTPCGRVDRHRCPEGFRRRRPRRQEQGPRAAPARRRGRGGGRGRGMALLGALLLLHRRHPRHRRRPRALAFFVAWHHNP
jgi:short-subunit dehydrogenase involved in D-alanine esterification of teichoic acids